MQIIAHRGCSRGGPENTLAAFRCAVELGVDGMETDLRLAADGQLVLFHDRVVGGRETESLTHGELCDAAGFPVPTLAEALASFPDTGWVLELKSAKALPATLAAIEPLADRRRLMLISFWHALILEAAQRGDVDCGLSLGESPLGLLEGADAAAARWPRINTLVWNYEFLDRELWSQARSRGWRCLVYNAITRQDHDECRRLGADAVITDSVEYLLERP